MFSWFDIALGLLLLGALLNGFRVGLIRTLANLAGLIAGGVLAFFATPWLMSLVPDTSWRTMSTVAVVVLCLVAGITAGGFLGRIIRGGAARANLGAADRALGAASGLVVASLVVSTLASSVTVLGLPIVSPVLANSAVLRTVDQLTPTPVRAAVAQARDAVFGSALPWLVKELGSGPVTPPSAPTGPTNSAGVNTAAASTVRVAGAAYQCGQTVTGSGFVIAPGRVITNAHVVAGVTEPVVEAPGNLSRPGRVVYVDSSADLAVIAVDGLTVAALQLAAPPSNGDNVAVAGYPFGGPYQVRPGRVESVGPVTLDENGTTSTRTILTLAANVDHGNSGGPVLNQDGRVVGVVFAKSASVSGVGYAVPLSVLAPVAAQAGGLSTAVNPGACTTR